MERTQGTLDRASKGPIAPPPTFKGIMAEVAETVSKWPGVISTAHWDLYDSSRIDGVALHVKPDKMADLERETFTA